MEKRRRPPPSRWRAQSTTTVSNESNDSDVLDFTINDTESTAGQSSQAVLASVTSQSSLPSSSQLPPIVGPSSQVPIVGPSLETVTTAASTPQPNQEYTSVSAKKLSTSLSTSPDVDDSNNDDDDSDADAATDSSCYLLLDTELLFNFLHEIVRCGLCSQEVNVTIGESRKLGLAQMIVARCSSPNCKWVKTFNTSKRCKASSDDISGRPAYDVNRRATIAFREIGKGHTGMKKFCGFMNMPGCINESAYNSTVNRSIMPAYKTVAKACMAKAINELHTEALGEINEGDDDSEPNAVADVTISADGT